MNISKIDINNFRLLKQTSINCEKRTFSYHRQKTIVEKHLYYPH